VAEGYHIMLGTHLFGLPKVSWVHLEAAAGSGGSTGVAVCLFFQCIMAWGSLPQASSSGCQSFNFP
jgi:hypothetical protein